MVGREANKDLLCGGKNLIVVDLDARFEGPYSDLAVEKVSKIDGVDNLALHQIRRMGRTLCVKVEIFRPDAEDNALPWRGAFSSQRLEPNRGPVLSERDFHHCQISFAAEEATFQQVCRPDKVCHKGVYRPGIDGVGPPVCWMCPLLMTIMLSLKTSASAWSWVT